MGNESRQKIDSLRSEMEKRGIDATLVFTSDEHGSEYIDDHYAFREYLSGFTGSAGSLLITGKEAGLWTDGRYFLQAESELHGSGIKLHKIGEKDVKDIWGYTGDIAKEYVNTGGKFTIGTDLKLISAASYKRIKKICESTESKVVDIDFASVIWKERPLEHHEAVYMLDDSVTGCSVGDKLDTLRLKLKEQSAGRVLISDLSDVMWLFNIRGSDIAYNPVAESFALVGKDDAYLFADLKCMENELIKTLKGYGVTVGGLEEFDEHIRKISGIKVICDLRTLNAHVYELLKGNSIADLPSWKYIGKHIKNPVECSILRDRHIKDGLAVTRFIYRIKKAVREGEGTGRIINEYDAAMMLDGMRSEIKGNRGLSFETIAAYGENAAVIHYTPDKEGSAVLKPEGFLLVDSGGQYDGATTDVTRTIALGELSDEMKLDYTAVLKGMLDLADAVFLSGTRGENLDILARRPIWERYIDYRHGTGHGVGAMLNVHEGPQAIRYRISAESLQPAFEPGMVTSDEPGIYLEGKYGIRIENLILCVEKENNEWGRFLGFETLTMVPFERDAILKDKLTVRQREMIDKYHSEIFKLYGSHLDDEEKKWLKDATAAL
ncbi:MAG: aminopeptidase P family protein [Lachnospiraceae bacterium]|nr:aminopeptidase P family protein [Lachnospiraceae bacterium]